MLRQQQPTGTRCSVLLKPARVCLLKHPNQFISLEEEIPLYTTSLLIQANLEVQYRVIKCNLISFWGEKQFTMTRATERC